MWIAFAIVTLALAAYTTRRFYGDRMLFVPGKTTAGHHQIETECLTCHTPMVGVKSDACTQCHAEELERADDSHPKSKFTDPRNADLLSKLDARECITCHIEHRPERTLAMGVTQPSDFCSHCHADIGEERASHQGLAFNTCQNGGCHNFHDNRALNEDFLEARLKLDDAAPTGHVAIETKSLRAQRKHEGRSLVASDADAPSAAVTSTIVEQWAGTTHARMTVNCTQCHTLAQDDGSRGAWVNALSPEHCNECHGREVDGFVASRHGMRVAAKLSPMRVEDAWLPMRDDAAHQSLTCTSCHDDHAFDRQRAAVNACVACHADEHSRNYLKSKHYALWQAEVAGAGVGSGVSCATCHLPRDADMPGGVTSVRHNQNDYLRPNEKMIASVCVSCHAAEWSMDALASAAVIARGVEGSANAHVQSMEMVRRKLATSATTHGPNP